MWLVDGECFTNGIPCIDRVRRVVARARDQEHELPRVKMKFVFLIARTGHNSTDSINARDTGRGNMVTSKPDMTVDKCIKLLKKNLLLSTLTQ